MDGVFWRDDLIDRNKLLNEAAIQSDDIIFISEFSKKSFFSLYSNKKIKKEHVILNNVDENIFYPTQKRKDKISLWGASATNWNRKEKRPDELLKFAEFINRYNEKILIIGESKIKHKNIINVGYFNDYKKLSNMINLTDSWVNFSYRDAAPKTVLQAIKCNKPILYSDSGGLSEIVEDFGVPIIDNKYIDFAKCNFELNFEDIKKSYFLFKEMYNKNIFKKKKQKKYLKTLQEYVDIFKNSKK